MRENKTNCIWQNLTTVIEIGKFLPYMYIDAFCFQFRLLDYVPSSFSTSSIQCQWPTQSTQKSWPQQRQGTGSELLPGIQTNSSTTSENSEDRIDPHHTYIIFLRLDYWLNIESLVINLSPGYEAISYMKHLDYHQATSILLVREGGVIGCGNIKEY